MAKNQNYAQIKALGLSVNITTLQAGWAYLSLLADDGSDLARVKFRSNSNRARGMLARAPAASRGSHLDRALAEAYEAIGPADRTAAQARELAKQERLALISDPLPTGPSRPCVRL